MAELHSPFDSDRHSNLSFASRAWKHRSSLDKLRTNGNLSRRRCVAVQTDSVLLEFARRSVDHEAAIRSHEQKIGKRRKEVSIKAHALVNRKVIETFFFRRGVSTCARLVAANQAACLYAGQPQGKRDATTGKNMIS